MKNTNQKYALSKASCSCRLRQLPPFSVTSIKPEQVHIMSTYDKQNIADEFVAGMDA